MAVSAAILEIFSVKEWPDFEIWVWGPSRSLRMAPFDRSRMTLFVSHCNYSSILYHLRVIWRLIIRWPWNMALKSLKVIETGAIQKLGAVSYSPSIVTMAVSLAISEIFSVKEWPDLEMWVWVCSRSLKMAQFDRPCMTFYWSAIVTIALSCTVCELFDVE